MAKIVFYRDDFDGTEDSTVRPRVVRFEEGTLSLDLSDDNYGSLMDALRPFLDKGEWTERETSGSDENTVIREWARANGFDVSPRGRLSREVTDAYREWQKSQERSAQASDATPDATPDNVDTDSDTDADNGNVSAPVPVNA